MKSNPTNTKRTYFIAISFFVLGAILGWLGADRFGSGSVKPLSPCEQKCISDNPNDTQARLNCMLKCVADGK